MSDPLLSKRFVTALKLAHRYHIDQRRKDTEIPYLSHLLQVAGLVLEAGGDEDQAIAGLLHDAIEDAESLAEAVDREREIQENLPGRVLELVHGCTDGNPQEKEELDWIDRKLRYIGRLESKATRDVLLVSVSDKLHNARAILRDFRSHGRPFWSRFSGGELGSLWYYRALVDAYQGRGVEWYVDELDELVTTLERESGHPEGVTLEEARAALDGSRNPPHAASAE